MTTTDIYTEAEARLAEARKVHDDARSLGLYADNDDTHARLLLKIANGDETITTTDLAAAREEGEMTKARAKAAANALQRIERKGGPWRPTVALPLVEIVAKALDVSVAYSDDTPGREGEPLTAVIRQSSATARDALEGTLSAVVEVRSYRTRRHLDTDWKALEKALNKAGVRASVHSRAGGEGEGVVWDDAEIDVNAVVPEGTLFLAYAKSGDCSGSARSATYSATEYGRSKGQSAMTATDPKGKRFVTGSDVKSEVEFRLQQGSHDGLTEAAKSLEGLTLPGLGLCTSVTVDKLDDAMHYDDTSARKFTQVSVKATFAAVTK